MKKVNLCIFLTCCFLVLGMTNQKAYAQENNTIPITGEWVSGSVSDDVYFYTFTIPSSGTGTYTFQSYSEDGGLCLKDETLATTYSRIQADGSPSNPSSVAQTNILEQGTYVLKICQATTTDLEWAWTGSYRLNVTFTPANNNETEPNDTFETAMDLTENNQILGLISDSENDDYFKFTLEDSQKIHIIYRFDAPFIFSLYDNNFLPIVEGNPYVPSSGTEEWVDTLEAGTYYINISKYWDSGIYTLKWFIENPVSSIKLNKQALNLNKGKTYNLLPTIEPTNATDQSLTWSSSDTTVASVNASGKIKANKTGAAIITATTQDGTKLSASCVVIVLPEKEKITKLSASSNKVNVKLKKQKGVSGYQVMYSTDKSFKTKKTYITTSSSSTAKRLKKGKKYYFKARAFYTYKNKRSYGAWSDVKAVKTEKK